MKSVIFAAFSAVVAVISLSQGQTYPRLEEWNKDEGTHVLENNSFIDRTVIREGSSGVLRCVTDNPDCCSGNWFDNIGQLVPPQQGNISSSFYTTTASLVNGFSVHGLKYREGGNTAVGVFRCDIPDLHRHMKSLYIYIGSNTIGS